MKQFDAYTKYGDQGDFSGTAAADGFASPFDVQKDLEELGVQIEEGESLIGISLSFDEIMRPHALYPKVTPYVDVFFERDDATQRPDPVSLRKVRVDFSTPEAFLRIFKRFRVCLSLSGTMTGRYYEPINSDEE